MSTIRSSYLVQSQSISDLYAVFNSTLIQLVTQQDIYICRQTVFPETYRNTLLDMSITLQSGTLYTQQLYV